MTAETSIPDPPTVPPGDFSIAQAVAFLEQGGITNARRTLQQWAADGLIQATCITRYGDTGLYVTRAFWLGAGGARVFGPFTAYQSHRIEVYRKVRYPGLKHFVDGTPEWRDGFVYVSQEALAKTAGLRLADVAEIGQTAPTPKGHANHRDGGYMESAEEWIAVQTRERKAWLLQTKVPALWKDFQVWAMQHEGLEKKNLPTRSTTFATAIRLARKTIRGD